MCKYYLSGSINILRPKPELWYNAYIIQNELFWNRFKQNAPKA